MKKTKFYLLSMIVFLAFSLSACNKSGEQDASNKQDANSVKDAVILNSDDSSFSGTIEDVMEKGKSMECSIETDNEDMSMNSIYFFDSKNKRFRVEMEVAPKTGDGHVRSVSIVKDGWSYSWSELNKEDGIKIKIEDDSDEDYYDDDDEGDIEEDEEEEEFDFKCKNWKVENSKFELPKDRDFIDTESLINNVNNLYIKDDPINYLSFDACSFCDMLPAGPEKDECLTDC